MSGNNLAWSSKKPSKRGYYWWRRLRSEPRLVELLYFAPEGLVGRMAGESHLVEIYAGRAVEWWGPIPSPQYDLAASHADVDKSLAERNNDLDQR